MRRSTDHILTSHGGNLPRPEYLDALIGDPKGNKAEIAKRLPGAVQEVVDQQIACGVDIVNDGEYVKAAASGYSGYIHQRVTGYERLARDATPPKRDVPGARDKQDFPGFYNSGLWYSGAGGPLRPGFFKPEPPKPPTSYLACTGAVTYVGKDAIASDVAALKAALRPGVDGFIAALGPLSLGAGAVNKHYPNETDYMVAVAEALRNEYKAVTDAGLILQIDEPEFATTWMFYPDWDVAAYRKYLEGAVEIINHAVKGLPEEQIRFHMCWGSGHRPHVHDIPFENIADLLLKVNAQAYSFEASNVRHAHEWRLWEALKLPDGKILIPGVVGHATDLVEHPDLVAERLINFGRLVGMENLQGGTDCGIGSRVGHAEIAWAKLKALADGATIASKALQGK